MTTFRKKMTLSALAVSMLTASLGGLPLSQKGLTEKFGLIHVANAAESQLPSNPFLERMNLLYAALVAGDPADVQDVRNLRDEIAGLDDTADQHLIDPIWNKISGKLPASVDQAELKTSLFRLVKIVGSFQFDPQASDLEAIRTNPEFRTALSTLVAAGGGGNIMMDDLLVFLFGDGASRKGVKGTITDLLADKSPLELMQLLGNKQGITEVLLQATGKLLSETNAYKFSSILTNLGVTPQDMGAVVLGFQLKLQKEEPAINAMAIALIRSEAVGTAIVSEDGLRHDYSLKVFGMDIPALVLQWTKVSGSPDVSVAPNGTVTIPEDVASASAIIQAKLVNPFSGAAKVIFEQEVTLTAAEGEEEGDIFPAAQFLERMNKLRAALIAGGPADVLAVRNLRDEIAGLDVAANQALIDPVWNQIAPKLPASVDQAKLKASLFEIIKAVGSFQYDPQASTLEPIRTNPEYRATLKTIAAAGGVNSLRVDDILIFLFGDGEDRKGVEGTILGIVSDMKPKELAGLLGNQEEINAVMNEAMAEILSEKEAYAFSAVLYNLGVTPVEVRSMVLNFQIKLKYDEVATNAMAIAYIRSEAKSKVKVTANGRHHEYDLTVLGVEIPSSILKWTKVSGSKDVEVDTDGKVSIPNKVTKGTAVIQAALVNPNGGPAKVIFQQEVTLERKDNPKDKPKDKPKD